LFEGVDETIYNNQYNHIDLDIKEDFAFLFVGHWLKGDLGQDRKDVGMLIKCFAHAFSEHEDKPALVLKTSSATFSVKQREDFKRKISELTNGIENPPPIYLLFGDLTNSEMNELYNHPKIKSMVSITKGEGFGRPLLEFTMTGKPVIASNWSGHKDFLPMDKAIMVGGKLTDVHNSAVDDFVISGSKWFTANYNEFTEVLKLVHKDYNTFLAKSEILREENLKKFTLNKMKERFETIITTNTTMAPQQKEIILPKLNKVK
jgi:glycosyltransferase involved in cell wall biosynthesis